MQTVSSIDKGYTRIIQTRDAELALPGRRRAAPSGLKPAAPDLLEQVWTGDRSEASGKRRQARYRKLHEVSDRGGKLLVHFLYGYHA